MNYRLKSLLAATLITTVLCSCADGDNESNGQDGDQWQYEAGSDTETAIPDDPGDPGDQTLVTNS